MKTKQFWSYRDAKSNDVEKLSLINMKLWDIEDGSDDKIIQRT